MGLTIITVLMQANKYTVLDQNGEAVALIAEDMTGIGNAIGRQVLKTRRSFTATVFSADGMYLKDEEKVCSVLNYYILTGLRPFFIWWRFDT